jgi:SRSO17 transposase
MSVYLIVSLQIEDLSPHNDSLSKSKQTNEMAYQDIQRHPWWNQKIAGKTYLIT